MKKIDCRGLNCPEPVLKTKDVLAREPDKIIQVLVDNETARENVLRFAKNQGRSPAWEKDNNQFLITIPGKSEQKAPEPLSVKDEAGMEKPVLFIATDEMGKGSRELGTMLMRNFIYTLTKRDQLPAAIIFMNSGVKLSIADSPVIEELGYLEQNGVQILVCGTCLDYYELKEKHKAGLVSNMYDIADLLLGADRVISI